jgi:hypothetical protein
LDPEISQIGAKARVSSGSKIHSVGARQVIAPVKTVFQAILKRYPAKLPANVTPCRIQGQLQVKPQNRPKAALTL